MYEWLELPRNTQVIYITANGSVGSNRENNTASHNSVKEKKGICSSRAASPLRHYSGNYKYIFWFLLQNILKCFASSHTKPKQEKNLSTSSLIEQDKYAIRVFLS